jgi:hypothetical protein
MLAHVCCAKAPIDSMHERTDVDTGVEIFNRRL